MSQVQEIEDGRFEGCYRHQDEVYIFHPLESANEVAEDNQESAGEVADVDLEEDSGESSSTQDNSAQAGLDSVIVPSDEMDKSDNPECEFCGEPMEEAPENVAHDWTCQNSGCEGVETEQEEENQEDDNIIFEA